MSLATTTNEPQTPEEYLELIGDWQDPYQEPIIKEHDGFLVLRDDLIGGGSKIRFVDYIIKETPATEIIFGCCPASGWAQVSLPKACNMYGKKSVLFMAYRKPENYTCEQRLALEFGADFRWVRNGMMSVTKKRAHDYAMRDPDNRMDFPIGLEHPTVLASIIRVARNLPIDPPKEIWSVGSSGTINRGLQLAFPDAEVNVVSVGHNMDKRAIGRAKYYRSSYAFNQSVSKEDTPPYSSVLTYDAKVWPFVKKYASPGALVWNVAGDITNPEEFKRCL